MTRVKDLLNVKGHEVWSIEPGASVYDALKLMADKEVGALVVMEGTKLVGIFSERDYARKVILRGRFSKDVQIREIMSTHIVTVEPDQNVEECMGLMTDKHVRHLPVMEGDQLLGVISIGDLVKSIIAGQRLYIEQMERFVKGR